ncbi:MAG: iron complex transport system substrate-binding protein [Proteobacteria bacterium]|nr:iron complex transport system substrate-binding protein [Pseudomonadota bacterium]
MKITAPMTALLVWLMLIAPAGADIVVRDDSGADIRLKSPARRIVSLAPHITENLYVAGAGAYVVGVTDYSDYPPVARQLPRIGQSGRMDMEALLALKPDLVIAWQGGTPTTQIEKLKALGLAVFLVRSDRMASVASDIEYYGQLAGTPETANRAAAQFRQRLAALRTTYSGKAPVRVFYQIWQRPMMTVGARQLITDAIRLCGGENIFGQLSTLAPTVNVEAVLAARPQVIIASGNNAARPPWLDEWKRWPQLEAVRRNQLYHIDPDLIQRHTFRLLEGAEQLCQQIDSARIER